jgi:single-strand DNA-binding protein
MSLNRIMLIGHLGQDPEIRYTPAGMPIVNFSVATDEAYVDKDGKRQERTEWRKIVVVAKLALTCYEYLKRGRQVFVEGRLRTREWESNGTTARRTEIVASRVQFLGSPPADSLEKGTTGDPSPEIDQEAPA